MSVSGDAAHGESPGRSSSIVTRARALRVLANASGPFVGIVPHSIGTVAATHALARGLAVGRLTCAAPGADLADYACEFSRLLGLPSETSIRMRRRIKRKVGVSWDSWTRAGPRRTCVSL